MADWFVRQTTTNILNAVASSTKMYVQNDSSDRDCLCMEFMNVLAAVSHCGFATETVSSMSRIVLDECNLGPCFQDGVQLTQVLSVLAKARGDMFHVD